MTGDHHVRYVSRDEAPTKFHFIYIGKLLLYSAIGFLSRKSPTTVVVGGLMEGKVALPNGIYPPFLGVDAVTQEYESAFDGAPLYHCVFPVGARIDTPTLINAIAEYRKNIRLPPSMCLAFRDRGTVCIDDFLHHSDSDYDMLAAEIKFVRALPYMNNLLGCDTYVHMRSFMGQRAKRPLCISEYAVIYNIDPRLSGRQIAEEARQHFEYLRDTHRVEKLVLRFPNSGTVMVHRYMETVGQFNLSTAIQRARKMQLPKRSVRIAA